jgi:hypothetical protein
MVLDNLSQITIESTGQKIAAQFLAGYSARWAKKKTEE